jgi:transcriptional regulator with XRE-family HTH domain
LATNTMRIREATDMGHVVRARRRVLGWSQDRLAKTAGVGRQWVLELERGKSGAPLDLLIKLLAVLGFALDVFDDAPARLLASPERGSGRSVGPLANQGERPTGRRPPPPVTLNSIPRQFTSEPSRNGRDDTGEDNGREYQPTDLAAAGITADRHHLYELVYRPVVYRMASHAILHEGPLFLDVLARRIAGAHGLARATQKLFETCEEITEPFPHTIEGSRKVIWPENADIKKLTPFRYAPRDARDHFDIPLQELASLALRFLAEGHSIEKTLVLVSKELGLGRIMSTTRPRLEAAAELAKLHMLQQQ